MPSSTFHFKQFCISQEDCAMKVGTDGVLLGAWACMDGCKTVVDVGTGTGLLALMLKQRYPALSATGVEIDPRAAAQAAANVAASPWQVEVVCNAWQHYAAAHAAAFDALVCNPPYFKESLKCPSARRTLARHADSLSLRELFAGAAYALNKQGRVCLVLPIQSQEEAVMEAQAAGFYLVERCLVYPLPNKPAKRVLLRFERQAAPCVEHQLIVEQERGVYTPACYQMVAPFYLRATCG